MLVVFSSITSTKGKVEEAVAAIKDGQWSDMVMNIGFLKSEIIAVKSDIEEVVKAVKGINKEAKVKVTLKLLS